MKRKKYLLPNKTQLKMYLELRKMGASPKKADNFIARYRLGKRMFTRMVKVDM